VRLDYALLSVKSTRTGIGQGEDVNWLRNLAQRWSARHFSLVCPHCRRPASSVLFRRGRYMLGDEKLVCEQCGTASVVTFWRFEGLCHGERDDSSRREHVADAGH
jgi:hypothetical protein